LAAARRAHGEDIRILRLGNAKKVAHVAKVTTGVPCLTGLLQLAPRVLSL
jgi:hypothetical protein